MTAPLSISGNEKYSVSSPSQLSPAAQEEIKKRTRFTDYLPSEIWPLCRDGFRESQAPYSDSAQKELIESVVEKKIAECRILELTPKTFNKAEHKIILYIHGGAFTLGAPDFQMQIPAPVAFRTGYKVIAIDYPLAPYSISGEYPAHTAVFEVYKELLKEYKSSEIGFLADSAGGNIAFGVALMARDQGLGLPNAIVAYAPWVDLEQKGSTYSNSARIAQTVVLTPESLASSRDAAFGKKEIYSPYISPIHGDYKDFSSVSVAIYTAGRDLLREEDEQLAGLLRYNAKSVDLVCKEGMWHGYQEHYKMPEAEECADKAATFLRQNLI